MQDNFKTLKAQIEEIRARKRNRNIPSSAQKKFRSSPANNIKSESRHEKKEGSLEELLHRIENSTGRSNANQVTSEKNDYEVESPYQGYGESIAANSDMELFQQKKKLIRNRWERTQIEQNPLKGSTVKLGTFIKNNRPKFETCDPAPIKKGKGLFNQLVKVSSGKKSRYRSELLDISSDSEEFKDQFSRKMSSYETDNSKQQTSSSIKNSSVERPIEIEGLQSLNPEERMNYLENTEENDVLQQLKTLSQSPYTQVFSKEDNLMNTQNLKISEPQQFQETTMVQTQVSSSIKSNNQDMEQHINFKSYKNYQNYGQETDPNLESEKGPSYHEVEQDDSILSQSALVLDLETNKFVGEEDSAPQRFNRLNLNKHAVGQKSNTLIDFKLTSERAILARSRENIAPNTEGLVLDTQVFGNKDLIKQHQLMLDSDFTERVNESEKVDLDYSDPYKRQLTEAEEDPTFPDYDAIIRQKAEEFAHQNVKDLIPPTPERKVHEDTPIPIIQKQSPHPKINPYIDTSDMEDTEQEGMFYTSEVHPQKDQPRSNNLRESMTSEQSLIDSQNSEIDLKKVRQIRKSRRSKHSRKARSSKKRRPRRRSKSRSRSKSAQKSRKRQNRTQRTSKKSSQKDGFFNYNKVEGINSVKKTKYSRNKNSQLSRSISRSPSPLSETSLESSKNGHKKIGSNPVNQKMQQFLEDMLPEKYSQKDIIPVKTVAKLLANYFGYSKSEKYSLIEFLTITTQQVNKTKIALGQLVTLVPEDDMINTYFLRQALNTKFRLKVNEIKAKFSMKDEVMEETAKLIQSVKKKEKMLKKKEISLKKGFATEKKAITQEFERKRVKIELSFSKKIKELEKRFDEFSKRKIAQVNSLRKDFLNTKKMRELLNEDRLKLQKKVDKLETDLKKSKSKAKKGSQQLKQLKKNVKVEIAEIKKEVEQKEVITFEKDIQCDILKQGQRKPEKENLFQPFISECGTFQKLKRENIINQFSDHIPQITHRNRETLALKLIEFHLEQIQLVNEKIEQRQLSTHRKILSTQRKLSGNKLSQLLGDSVELARLKSIEQSVNPKALIALLEYSLSSMSKSDRLSSLQPQLFNQQQICQILGPEKSIFECLIDKTDLVEELDKFKVIGLKQAQEFFSVFASKLIQKTHKEAVLDLFFTSEQKINSGKFSTPIEAQPSFWMTYLIKSSRYAIKLKMGTILSTSVLIAERISYFAFSEHKEVKLVIKYGKECLALHRQMLIILIEDISNLISSEIHKQNELLLIEDAESEQSPFRSGVMDISPRDPAERLEKLGMDKLEIDWISDVEFLQRNLHMVKTNLGLD